MSDDTEAAALRARLEAIVKKVEDIEAQATAARRHVEAVRLLLEEESKATALEQMAIAIRQRVPSLSSSSSSPAAASQLVPTASSTYEDTVVAGCDRTTSEMRGLSPKIILGDSRRSENAQTHTIKHTIPNKKFKLKLLEIKCYVLGFTNDKAQNVLQKIIRVFAKAFVSHDRHTLFALEESEPPQTTYTYESQ
jgi:G:T/U-mismatch repair DNA glycosylase